jgi:hypothetical protein
MISDEDLLLYHYQDGLTPDEHARIAQAVANDALLEARLNALIARLDGAAPADVPVPAAAMHRWSTDLARAARVEADSRGTLPAFHWRTGLAAAAVLVFVATFGWHVSEAPQPTQLAGTSPVDGGAQAGAGDHDDTARGTREARYARSLSVHLARAELQLASLGTLDRDERARVVQKLIEQNRLYAVAAENAREDQLARVLRAFNPVLATLGDRQASAADLAAAVAQLNFEMKVMQAKLAASSGNAPSWPGLPLAL